MPALDGNGPPSDSDRLQSPFARQQQLCRSRLVRSIRFRAVSMPLQSSDQYQLIFSAVIQPDPARYSPWSSTGRSRNSNSRSHSPADFLKSAPVFLPRREEAAQRPKSFFPGTSKESGPRASGQRPHTVFPPLAQISRWRRVQRQARPTFFPNACK